MPSNQRLILFYSIAGLVVCDGFAFAHRFTLANPDSVSWAEIVVALVGQVAIVLVIRALLPFLTRKRDVSRDERIVLGRFGMKAVAIMILGLSAALSVTLFNHCVSCGDHPIPSRGTPNVCPK